MTEAAGRLFVREMGYSVDEFERAFPLAMRDFRLDRRVDGWSVSTVEGEFVAEVKVNPGPSRHIGALALPVLMVLVDLARADPGHVKLFMHRFDTGLHRGGG